MANKQLGPAAIGVIIVIVVALVGMIGFHYLNRPPGDPIAEAVSKERSSANSSPVTSGPMGGAAPPRAGASDYAHAPGATAGGH